METPQHVDLMIVHGTVITVDAGRRVLDDGAIAVDADRIVAVGPTAELTGRYVATRTIDAYRKAVLPGLIDSHAHAGHGLVKNLGGSDSDAWMDACRAIYTIGSDEEFWYAEARLAALERLRCGTTTGVCLLGGGDSIMRVDDPRYAERHCSGDDRSGHPVVPGGGTIAAAGASRLRHLARHAKRGPRGVLRGDVRHLRCDRSHDAWRRRWPRQRLHRPPGLCAGTSTRPPAVRADVSRTSPMPMATSHAGTASA